MTSFYEVKHPTETAPAVHALLVPENPIFQRAEDDWCPTCAKPSRISGKMLYLCSCGIGPWGTATGCLECKTWVLTDLNGDVKDMPIID